MINRIELLEELLEQIENTPDEIMEEAINKLLEDRKAAITT